MRRDDAKAKQEQQEVKQKVKQKKMVYDELFCATFGMSEDFRPNDYCLQTNNEVKIESGI